MAKRKDSIALFEVIKNKRNEVNLNVPKWMGGQGAAGVEEPPAAPPPAAASRVEEPAQGGGGEFALKLTGMHLALAGAGALLVVIVSVWIGYAMHSTSRPAATPADGGSMRSQVPAGRHVAAKSGGQGTGTAAAGGGSKAPAAASKRIDGKYYLVIQAIPGGGSSQAAEAKQIAAWCTQNGEPATVATFTQRSTGKKWVIVWSLRPFDSPTSDAALAYGHQIETLGKKYMAEYKRYDFRQRNNNKFDPWYLPYKG